MKNLSQKEIINETFAGMLGKMLKDTAKTAVKLATPTGGEVLSKAKTGISNLKSKFKEKPNTPELYVDNFLRKYSNVVYDIRNIKSYKKGAQSFKLTNDPSIKNKLKDKPLGIGLVDKSDLSQTNLYIVDLELKLRDQNTYDPIDEWIQIKGIPVTYTENKEGNIQYDLPISNVKDIKKYIVGNINNSKIKKALNILDDKLYKKNTKLRDDKVKPSSALPKPRQYRK